MPTAPTLDLPRTQLSKPEFVALIAMNFAMVAFSIDAMLPALPAIAAAITPDDVNRAQLVLTSFVLGMGIGTLFTGPLSDAYGRKPVIAWGIGLYCLGALLAGRAESMEQMMAARLLQGLGVAAPRIVALAIIRDLYAGRPMAQIMSFAMVVFTLVPAAAPLIGALIIEAAGWRSIFYIFIAFALTVTGWLMIRQPETLPPAQRLEFRPARLWAAVKRCFSVSQFRISALAQAMTFGMLFGTLSSMQQIFADRFDKVESFPLWFGLIALISGSASIINARLVMRLGMRRMILLGLLGQCAISSVAVALAADGSMPFFYFMVWSTSLFFMVGFVLGNLSAIAMEPLGDVAGMAASVLGAIATVLGVAFAVPIGLAFNGTTLPLASATLALSLLSAVLVLRALPAGEVHNAT